jgi:hypothetical protein
MFSSLREQWQAEDTWAGQSAGEEVRTDRLRLLRCRRQRNARNADLFLALASLGNVVRRLHTDQRIHLDSEGLLDAERHFSGEIGLAIEQTG